MRAVGHAPFREAIGGLRSLIERPVPFNMLFSRNKPRWLYAAMPAVYLLAGIAAICSLRNTFGLASGCLLVAAAIAILAARRLGARAFREAEPSRQSSLLAPPSRLAATTEFVRAIVPPKLGHRDIDRQHRSLASKAATLRVAFAHNDDQADLELLIHELMDALAHHLQAEIHAMGRLGVSRTDEDVDADRMELAKAEYDFDLYCAGGMTMEELIERVAGPLVAGHLMRRHPALPSMESLLQQLREVKAPG